MELKRLQQEISDMKKDFLTKSKDLFSKDIAGIFERNPELEKIAWTQYSPFFNDGDECVFSVHDLHFKRTGEVVEEDEEDYYDIYEMKDVYDLSEWIDSFIEPQDENRWKNRIQYVAPENEQLFTDLVNLNEVICSPEGCDIMYDMFGNHAQVIIYRDRIEVDEYSHD